MRCLGACLGAMPNLFQWRAEPRYAPTAPVHDAQPPTMALLTMALLTMRRRAGFYSLTSPTVAGTRTSTSARSSTASWATKTGATPPRAPRTSTCCRWAAPSRRRAAYPPLTPRSSPSSSPLYSPLTPCLLYPSTPPLLLPLTQAWGKSDFGFPCCWGTLSES